MTFIEDYQGPLTLMVIFLFGRVLALKIHSVQHVMGLQQVIMSCLLPALLLKSITALPMSELSTSWRYPMFALAYCLFLMVCIRLVLWLTQFVKLRQERSTILLMFPGLAPGLTSLPYVSVSVAEMEPKNINGGHVGLADLGIKFFVLFVLFIVAVQMSRCTHISNSTRAFRSRRVLSSSGFCRPMSRLVYGFLTEPVTFASVLGIVLLSAGPVRLEDASIAGSAITHIGRCCTPAILLLIGMKVKILRRQQGVLLILMVLRSGLGFLFSYLLSRMTSCEPNETMLWIFLCNSSLSFWPYTHICKIGAQEDEAPHTMCHNLLEEAAEDQDLSQEVRLFLTHLRDNLQAGTSDVESVIEQATLFARSIKIKSLITTCNMGEGSVNNTARLNDLVWDLDKVLEITNTFDPTLALMALSVSMSWTIFSCTILALTPVDFWTSTNSLPTIGGAMVFISAVGLRWIGWDLGKKKAPCSSQEKEEDAPNDSISLTACRAEKRFSILGANARISMMEACEADFALREESAEGLLTRLSLKFGPQREASPSRKSSVNYGLRKSLERLHAHDMEQDLRVSFCSSLEFSGSAPQALQCCQSNESAMSNLSTSDASLPPSKWQKDMMTQRLDLQGMKEDFKRPPCSAVEISGCLRQAGQCSTSKDPSMSNLKFGQAHTLKVADDSLPPSHWRKGSLAVCTLLGKEMSAADREYAYPCSAKL